MKRKPAPMTRTAKPTPPKRRRRRLPWIAIVLAVLGAAIALASSLYVRGKGSESATEFLQRARAAEERRDYQAAFAIYREGLRRHPDDLYLLGSFATATSNASYLVRTNRGRPVPVVATSLERVEAAHEALALLERAKAAAPASGKPSLHRGLIQAAWGLPEDALLDLFDAAQRGERSPELERAASAITVLQIGRTAAPDTGSAQNGSPANL